MKKGSKVHFIDTERGSLTVPVVSLESLSDVDKDRKEILYKMIKELQGERRKEASHDE